MKHSYNTKTNKNFFKLDSYALRQTLVFQYNIQYSHMSTVSKFVNLANVIGTVPDNLFESYEKQKLIVKVIGKSAF